MNTPQEIERIKRNAAIVASGAVAKPSAVIDPAQVAAVSIAVAAQIEHQVEQLLQADRGNADSARRAQLATGLAKNASGMRVGASGA